MSFKETALTLDTSVDTVYDAYMCFPHLQTKNYCNQYDYGKTYGGCPYWSCFLNDEHTCYVSLHPPSNPKCVFYHSRTNGTMWIRISDPWDDRWQKGVHGAFYPDDRYSQPFVKVSIFRTYALYNVTWDLSEVAKEIHDQEQKLTQMFDSQSTAHPLLTWVDIIQNTLYILNDTSRLNLTSCFLCTALSRPLLAATPLWLNDTPSYNLSLATPNIRKTIPLAPSETNVTCIHVLNATNYTSPIACTLNITINQSCSQEPYLYWCNYTTYQCINASVPSLCIPVLLIPQLSYYSLGEFEQFFGCRRRRAVLLPVLIGTALAGTATAIGLSAGALAHSILQGQHFENLRQVNLQSTAESLESLQRQLTSLAQVVLQNWSAIDLLMADKGGTCLFLQEECCYYVNESGIVEQNVKRLKDLRNGLLPPTPSHLFSAWFTSPVMTWLAPLISPFIIIIMICTFAPCLLKFLQKRMEAISAYAVYVTQLRQYWPLEEQEDIT
nr:endogenous retrovirus group FC1 Env polyprotein-like [Dasypus novemcinctus]